MEICKKAIEESGWAIEKEYGFPADVILGYRAALTDKCTSSELPDEILRVVREPLRKLGAGGEVLRSHRAHAQARQATGIPSGWCLRRAAFEDPP